MSEEHFYEVTITVRDAAAHETIHAEYQTAATNPHNAARELLDHSVKARGNNHVREIDPSA